MDVITLTREQWDRLVALIDELDSAWNMTQDGRDAGEWTVEERFDRLEQASFAGLNAQLLIDEIEATNTRREYSELARSAQKYLAFAAQMEEWR